MGNFIYKYTWKAWSSPISLLANSARGIKNLLFDKYRHCPGPMALNQSQEEGGPFTGKVTRSWGKVERETGAQEGVAMLWKSFLLLQPVFLRSSNPTANNTVKRKEMHSNSVVWVPGLPQIFREDTWQGSLNTGVGIDLESSKWVNMRFPLWTNHGACFSWKGQTGIPARNPSTVGTQILEPDFEPDTQLWWKFSCRQTNNFFSFYCFLKGF